ncbi:MAG: hypothetical protein JJ850_01390 [Kordiimonadaceae bacterium]|nr:hypothetical protein [Kordiimonadaceae bacterium]MBO6567545.1 hypothetical protein [Kordiimonadaceae bacterium]MBO6963241.1 hypothetical protein [Kordiimonadaceae bacterium]
MRSKVIGAYAALVFLLFGEQAALAQAKECGEATIRGTWERITGNLSQPTYWSFRVTDRKRSRGFQEGSISCRGDCDRAAGQPLAFRAHDFEFTLTFAQATSRYECEIVNNDTMIISRNYVGDHVMTFRRARR